MDGEFFWVVMLVLYLIFQVLGGRKKKKRQRQPGTVGPRPSNTVGRPGPEAAGESTQEAVGRTRSRPAGAPRRESVSGSRKRDPELDDALREIRRALGFPEADVPPRPEPKPRPEVIQEASEETEAVTGLSTTGAAPPSSHESYSQPGHREPPASERPPPARQASDARRVMRGISVDTESGPRRSGGLRQGSIKGVTPRAAPLDAYASKAKDDDGLAAIKKRLLAPQTLREAFVIKEILDPPRSKRSGR